MQMTATEDGNERTQEDLDRKTLAAKQAVDVLDAAVTAATSFREPAAELVGEAHRALNRLDQARGSKAFSELIVVASEISILAKRGLTLVKVHGGYGLLGKVITLVARQAIAQKFEKVTISLKGLIPDRTKDITAVGKAQNAAVYTGADLRQATHEKVHAITYEPDHHASSHVCIWWSAGRQLEFYTDASQSTTCFSNDKSALTVTSIAIDAYGQIWTGHLKGLVRVRKKHDWENVVEQRFFSHAVRCIAFDATGCAWMGDEAGYIKVVKCDEAPCETTVAHLQALEHVSSVYPASSIRDAGIASASINMDSGSFYGMMARTFWPSSNPPEPEPCEGPVRCMLIRDNRVWVGGGKCDPWIGTWDSREYVEQDMYLDLKPYGVPYCMTQIPWGVGNEALEWSNNHASWRLLTGHELGQVLMWNPTGKLQPLLSIEGSSGIRGISYLQSCNLVLTGHSNGQLALFSPPAAEVAITGTPSGRVVPVVKPLKAKVDAHKSAVTFTACQGQSVVSASSNGTIKLWHVDLLLAEANKQGLAVHWAGATFADMALTAREGSNTRSAGVETSAGSGTLLQPDGRGTLSVDNLYVIEPTELSLQKIIGNGAYGRVWLAEWGGTRVAVKEIGHPNGTESGSLQLVASNTGPGSDAAAGKRDDLEVLKNEMHMLGRLNHPNIVRFCAVCGDPPMIVMQHYPHGSLYDLLKKARRGQKATSELIWMKRLDMLRDVAAGMQFLHKRHVVHGDLRSPNLLLDYMVERGQPRFHIRIADFGLARVLGPRASNVAVSKHTNPRWAAPEVIMQSQLSRPADVYSFGVVMWELLTWQQPFEDMKSVQVIYSATQLNKRPEIPEDSALPGNPGATLPEYKQLMEVCWADDAERRPSFSQILAAVDHMREQETKPPTQRNFTRNQSLERVRALTAAPPDPTSPPRLNTPAPVVDDILSGSPLFKDPGLPDPSIQNASPHPQTPSPRNSPLPARNLSFQDPLTQNPSASGQNPPTPSGQNPPAQNSSLQDPLGQNPSPFARSPQTSAPGVPVEAYAASTSTAVPIPVRSDAHTAWGIPTGPVPPNAHPATPSMEVPHFHSTTGGSPILSTSAPNSSPFTSNTPGQHALSDMGTSSSFTSGHAAGAPAGAAPTNGPAARPAFPSPATSPFFQQTDQAGSNANPSTSPFSQQSGQTCNNPKPNTSPFVRQPAQTGAAPNPNTSPFMQQSGQAGSSPRPATSPFLQQSGATGGARTTNTSPFAQPGSQAGAGSIPQKSPFLRPAGQTGMGTGAPVKQQPLRSPFLTQGTVMGAVTGGDIYSAARTMEQMQRVVNSLPPPARGQAVSLPTPSHRPPTHDGYSPPYSALTSPSTSDATSMPHPATVHLMHSNIPPPPSDPSSYIPILIPSSLPSSSSSSLDNTSKTSLTHWPTSAANPFANTRPLVHITSAPQPSSMTHTVSLPNIAKHISPSMDSEAPLIRLDSDPLTPRAAAIIAQNIAAQQQSAVQLTPPSTASSRSNASATPHASPQQPSPQQPSPAHVSPQYGVQGVKKGTPNPARQLLISPFAMPAQQDRTL